MRMKNISMALLGVFMTFAVEARILSAKHILVEKTLSVGFAAPEYVGIYRFQVLSSGVVQNIDNKNKVTKLALLSESIVREVQAAIDTLPNDLTIVEENGPRCADSPSVNIRVIKNNTKDILIRSEVGCLTSDTVNSNAVSLANWVESLEKNLSTHFNSKENSPPASIGQEGYGNPTLTGSKKILSCVEEVHIADDGFSLYLEEILGQGNQYNLIIERSLFTGPATENYIVENLTDSHLLGSPARYENAQVKLSVQGTVTPRPDHKLSGSFVKKYLDGHSEVRKLLCSYID